MIIWVKGYTRERERDTTIKTNLPNTMLQSDFTIYGELQLQTHVVTQTSYNY